MTHDLRFAEAGPGDVAGRRDRYVELYRETMAEPPFREGDDEARSFGRELDGELAAEGFAAVELWAGDELGGFCYGYQGPPLSATGWMGRATTAVAPADRPLLDAQWAVGWLIVAPRWQGSGRGSQLFDRLMRHRTTPYAWLVTWPFDTPAVRLYERRGWERLGSGPLGWHDADRVVMAHRSPP
ncbi:GNAT family N-acetyltransferase [Actinoplanes sp. URMC 104]|uniref:GNAT family N-acetyltransferase n=1 Tax=Actinoplanes sp. URMC 104 TaxID=3423409 RepID=UPI003F196712